MSSEHPRVLFVALRWDYKDPARGSSFEYETFWGALREMSGTETRFFGIDEAASVGGNAEMNAALVRLVSEWRPSLVFFFLFKDEIEPETIRTVGRMEGVTTLNWFADDHWRFEQFSRRWAPLFDWVATTDPVAASRYRDLGLQGVIHTQWAFSPPAPDAAGENVFLEYDVTFVGQPYGRRREFIRRLSERGFRVNAWGAGWDAGRLTREEMAAVFATSRINLNFADSSRTYDPFTIVKQLLRRRGPILIPRFGSLRSNTRQILDARRPQIKARIFEVAGCGGLVLTEQVAGLDRYYDVGKEIVVFKSFDDLVAKIRNLLSDEDARAAIARAGQERTLREHTYHHRFAEIFERIGLTGLPK